MSLKLIFILSSLLASAYATPLTSKRDQRVQWGPCTFRGTRPIECGKLTVPLDYTDTTSGSTLQLSLLKVDAVNKPSKGSILFNFGGPGVESRKNLAAQAKILSAVTGGSYDLIAWDPRGTADTLTFTCIKNETERAAQRALFQVGSSANMSDPLVVGRNWVLSTIYAETCYANPESKERGSLIGTSFAVRDMMQIVDAVEGDGLLRYYGFSYGTILGATAAAMFPDRMDRMVLDGVLNVHEYYNSYDVELVADTDKVFKGFLENCVKSPSKCALARGQTADELELAIYNTLDRLKYHPIPWKGTFLDHVFVKTFLRSSLYSPIVWPILATTLDGLLSGNMTKFSAGADTLMGSSLDIMSGTSPDDSAMGIHCADKRTRTGSLEEMVPVINEVSTKSRLIGDGMYALALTCAQWKMDSKGRYTGSFQGVKTKNPVLFIGNTFDPATPLQSARNVSSGFEGSVLLQHNGYGHCTTSDPSICSSKAIQQYFADGTMPKQGALCEPDFGPFDGKTMLDILPQLGFQ